MKPTLAISALEALFAERIATRSHFVSFLLNPDESPACRICGAVWSSPDEYVNDFRSECPGVKGAC